MSGAALTRADALRARSQRFRDMLSRTYERLHETLQQCERPYVALSGGKDSTASLALVSDLRPGVTSIWSDDELEYPEQPDTIRAIARHCGSPPTIINGYAKHGGWFFPWRDQPFWRDPDPDMLWANATTQHWSTANGFDGAITGVRGQESRARRMHAMVRGDIYENHATRQTVIQPIIDWSIDDVWAYIAMAELPYHPVYDVLSAAGVPRDKQRIGPLPLTPRWILQTVAPTLPARLEARYGRHWS